ncbi:fibroblast growth factor receptor homolog 1-like isoform X2 [Thrips palmi]|uniref:receptor protein-tyrosine kinase n=1 Tax=Thrips palmi TaxID=161013 RepID=A0A6P8ZJL1_THRPL|nr:fibroblast growth factor receptor homolog 1-like isoform X2 [Thrips palmi]
MAVETRPLLAAVLLAVVGVASVLAAPIGVDEQVVTLVPGEHLEVEVDAGEKLRLRCPQDVQDVTWWKNGAVLGNSTRVRVAKQSVKWRAVKRKDAGDYGCRPRGAADSWAWANATLIVLGASKAASRLAPPSALSAQREDFLQDMQADARDPSLQDSLDSSADEDLTAPKAKTPRTEARREGDSVVLACPVAGPSTSPPFWIKDGEPFPMSRALVQGTSIEVRALRVADSGNYTCTVANGRGSDASTVLLRVFSRAEDIPLVLQAPRNASETLGGTASFACEPSPDAPESSRVRWVHLPPGEDVGAALDDDVMRTHEVQSRGGPPNVFPRLLVLDNLTLDDEGWYVCVVHNGVGKGRASASAWLHVMPPSEEDALHCRGNVMQGVSSDKHPASPPQFTKADAMAPYDAKPAGNMWRLKCPAFGNPCPNVTWTKDGAPIQRQWGAVRVGNWSIVLEELVTEDSGNYTCTVCNALGCVEHSTKLDVIERFRHKPYVKEGFPRNATALVGASASFECPLYADLSAFYQWFRLSPEDGAASAGGRGDEPPNGTLIQSGDDGADDPEVLRLTNVTHEDEGFYACVAGNSLGITYAMAYLRVVDTEETEPSQLHIQVAGPTAFVMNVLVAGLCLLFLIAVAVVISIFHRLKREKLKKLKALETAAAVTHWTKKVIVEPANRPNSGAASTVSVGDSQEPLLMPMVKIQKQKSSAPIDCLTISEYELPVDPDWEFPRDSMTLGKSLGEGAFGKVVRAEAHGILKQGVTTTVAVKMLKEGHTDAEMMDLVSEMEMMKMIGRHVNIINLLGCCTQDGPLYVVVEYAPLGNLRDFLRQQRPASGASTGGVSASGYERAIGVNRTLTHKDLVSFAYQVARGMEYLASRRCIHRDLAARNVLVSDDYVIKIADFGLARDIHCNDYYRKTTNSRIPVKWMAPEALFHRLYTTQSDVWSYGILLWEIMTLGGTPYPSMPSVENLFQLLRSGHRMEKPPACSLEMYMLMRECWSYQPNERPTFEELVEELDRILTVTANEEYLNLGMPQLVTPPSSEDEDEEDNDLELFPNLL